MVGFACLRTIDAFEVMSEKQLTAVWQTCEEISYEAGDRLFTEGEKANDLWVVLEGQVDLRFELPNRRSSSSQQTVTSVVVNDLHPQAKIIGWSCFVEPFEMRLSAYCASSTSRVIKINKAALLGLFAADPLMGYSFLSSMIKVVGGRFHQFQDHVAKNMGEDLMNGW